VPASLTVSSNANVIALEKVVPIPAEATDFVVIAIPAPAIISIGSSPDAERVSSPLTYQGLNVLPRSTKAVPPPSSVTLNPLPLLN